jgi:hypothetical protein
MTSRQQHTLTAAKHEVWNGPVSALCLSLEHNVVLWIFVYIAVL